MSFQTYVRNYPNYHNHPANKLLHLIGIPIIIMGIVAVLSSRWIEGIGLMLSGSMLLGAGHKIEGNKPALTGNPIYILAAPIWYIQTIVKFFSARS